MPKNKHPILSKTLTVNHLQGTPTTHNNTQQHTTTPPPSERSDSRRTTPAGCFRGSTPKQQPVVAVLRLFVQLFGAARCDQAPGEGVWG